MVYSKRTLTQYSSEFSTKDLRGWVEPLSGSIGEDEAFIIGSVVDYSAGENRIPNFQMIVSTKRLMKLLSISSQ